MVLEFLGSIQKALVPIVLAGVSLALDAVGVDLGVEQETLIAAGIITSVFTYLIKNNPID